MIFKILKSFYLGTVFRDILRLCLHERSWVPFRHLVTIQALRRPAHAYCMWHAADLALRLGIKEISAIEFGVGGGNTLRILEQYAARIKKDCGVSIHLLGFDTGAGLPSIDGERDLPYWFVSGQYPMDESKLRQLLTETDVVIGNINETLQPHLFNNRFPPIGAIFFDADLYSSTRDSLKIFEQSVERFLPRVFTYFDDVVGSPLELYGEFNGPLLALDHFNRSSSRIKIHLNRNLLPQSFIRWRYKIYYAHLFDHPLYSRYIGGSEQENEQKFLRIDS